MPCAVQGCTAAQKQDGIARYTDARLAYFNLLLGFGNTSGTTGRGFPSSNPAERYGSSDATLEGASIVGLKTMVMDRYMYRNSNLVNGTPIINHFKNDLDPA